MTKLHIVIVCYKSRHTIEECLNSLKVHLEASDTIVTIVDNFGEDGIETLVNQYHNVNYQYSGANIGFGAGCNIGFLEVDSAYTLFLNPDAVIDHTNISILLEFLDLNSDVAVVGPCIKSGESLQHCGNMPIPASFLASKYTLYRDNFRYIHPHEPPRETNWICGAIFMVRSSVFSEVGGFDENYFLYFEETDLCLRILAAGHRIFSTGESIASHIGGASSDEDEVDYVYGSIAEYFYDGRFYFMKKHYGKGVAVFSELHHIFRLILSSLKAVFTRRGNAYRKLKTKLSYPLFRTPQQNENKIFRTQPESLEESEKRLQICLTFDDAPSIFEHGVEFNPQRMIEILDILKKHEIADCTAFVIGEYIEGNENILSEWLDAGYSLGNHMFHHVRSGNLTPDEFRESVVKCDFLLDQLGAFKNCKTKWFRFPYLDYGKNDIQRRVYTNVLQSLGYQVAHASITFNDDKYEPLLAKSESLQSEKILSRYLKSSILSTNACMQIALNTKSYIAHVLYNHFGDVNTNSLDEVLTELKSNNVKFVSLDSALEDPFYSHFETERVTNGLAFDFRLMMNHRQKLWLRFRQFLTKLDLFRESKYGPYKKIVR